MRTLAERDLDDLITYTLDELDKEGGKKMKKADDFYKQLAELQDDIKRTRSGNHSHYCRQCKTHKYCPQITHCRLADEAMCFDCLDKISSARG